MYQPEVAMQMWFVLLYGSAPVRIALKPVATTNPAGQEVNEAPGEVPTLNT